MKIFLTLVFKVCLRTRGKYYSPAMKQSTNCDTEPSDSLKLLDGYDSTVV